MARKRSLIVATDGDLAVMRDPDRPTGRLLRQDDMDASYVDLADARYLDFDYLRWIRLILREFGAKRVLHIGGAACTLARALLAEDGESRQEVVEVEPRIFDIARLHLGLRRQPGLKLRVGDGRAAVKARADESFDAIVIDAFVGARVPRHLVTVEAIAQFARVSPLTVINIVDTAGLPDSRSVAAALGDSYAEVGGLSSGTHRASNIILFGSSANPKFAHLELAAAADASPAQLLRAPQLAGGAPWQDDAITGAVATGDLH